MDHVTSSVSSETSASASPARGPTRSPDAASSRDRRGGQGALLAQCRDLAATIARARWTALVHRRRPGVHHRGDLGRGEAGDLDEQEAARWLPGRCWSAATNASSTDIALLDGERGCPDRGRARRPPCAGASSRTRLARPGPRSIGSARRPRRPTRRGRPGSRRCRATTARCRGARTARSPATPAAARPGARPRRRTSSPASGSSAPAAPGGGARRAGERGVVPVASPPRSSSAIVGAPSMRASLPRGLRGCPRRRLSLV